MRTALAFALLLVATPAVEATLPGAPTGAAVSAPAQDRGLHKDERFGFKFKPPREWKSIALQSDEAWLAAKYLSAKSYFYTDPDTGYTFEHQPELMVIAFQHDAKKKKEVIEDEDEGTTTIVIHNPYKDYEDFLDRTYVGGGWYVDKKEEDEEGGLKVTKYEVKVEKLARTGPKRILTWIYHTEDIDFAMQTEVLEPEFRKLNKTLQTALKSFDEIERNGDLLPKSGRTMGAIRITRRELSAGTPKERRTVRMKSQKHLHERAIAGLPDDWDHEYHGDVLILNHDQDKWAKRIGAHAEMFLKWVEKEFDYFGKGEYARAPIIRVCKDQEEENAFSRGVVSGTGGNYVYVLPGSEITTHKDNTGWIGFEVGWVNRIILGQWLGDRDEDLASALPEWVSIGIREYVDGARQDGRQLDFRVDQWYKDQARMAVSKGSATSPRDIVSFTREEFRSDSGGVSGTAYWGHRSEAAMLVRFLFSRESGRCKQAKDLLEIYITTLKEVVDEIKEKEDDTVDSGQAETEEEEEEMARARNERWREREKEIMDETFERVFGDWSDKDWETFEKAYFGWLK